MAGAVVTASALGVKHPLRESKNAARSIAVIGGSGPAAGVHLVRQILAAQRILVDEAADACAARREREYDRSRGTDSSQLGPGDADTSACSPRAGQTSTLPPPLYRDLATGRDRVADGSIEPFASDRDAANVSLVSDPNVGGPHGAHDMFSGIECERVKRALARAAQKAGLLGDVVSCACNTLHVQQEWLRKHAEAEEPLEPAVEALKAKFVSVVDVLARFLREVSAGGPTGSSQPFSTAVQRLGWAARMRVVARLKKSHHHKTDTL